MKGLILNSGIGSRLGKYTENRPKCLVKIPGNDTILSYQLKGLKACGITEIIMTTGYLEDSLKSYMLDFPDFSVQYAYNPDYRSTNYIYSMYLARELLKEDIILLHGDMVCQNQVYRKVLETPGNNAVVINRTIPVPEKDFKGRLKGKKISEISVKIFGQDCYPLFPVYKICREDLYLWMEEISRFVERGDKSVYAEEALNRITERVELTACDITSELCMEIDTVEDLKTAWKRVKELNNETENI